MATRDRLAAAYEAAGRFDDAIAVFQVALAERERNQGPDHAEVIAARAHLAHAYASAGRLADAITTYQGAAADAARVLGPAHPVTLDARAGLAAAYQAAGQSERGDRRLPAPARRRRTSPRRPPSRHAERPLPAGRRPRGRRAARGRDRAVPAGAVRPRAGARAGHPQTIATRAALAAAFRSAGRHEYAIVQYQRVLADREGVHGAGHLETIAARASLAYAYRGAGRFRDALRALRAGARPDGSGSRAPITATP